MGSFSFTHGWRGSGGLVELLGVASGLVARPGGWQEAEVSHACAPEVTQGTTEVARLRLGVLCRLFTVGHLMQPVAKTVMVEVKTPDNVIIKQVPVSSPTKNGILSLTHNLPEVVSLGLWTISAKFEDSPDQDFSTRFEVKEYVLPSFEVSLVPEEKFLYLDRQADFRVSILAR